MNVKSKADQSLAVCLQRPFLYAEFGQKIQELFFKTQNPDVSKI